VSDRIPEAPMLDANGVYDTAYCRRRCVTIARELVAGLHLVERLLNVDDETPEKGGIELDQLAQAWARETRSKFRIP
jgi:hypothetical protein